MDDGIGGKLKKTLLYKMSLNGVLSMFHKVVLVSSPKDQYVPTYSARIQVLCAGYFRIVLRNLVRTSGQSQD